MQEKFLKSFDKIRIYYKIKRNKKDFLVFLHGLNLNHTIWKNEIEFFDDLGYSILTLDLRGFGKSEKPKEKYKIENFSKDLNEILNKENIKEIILVGFSLGGMISLNFYKQFPKKVKMLILINTAYKFSKDVMSPAVKYFGKLPLLLNKFTQYTKSKKYIDFSKLKNLPSLYIAYVANKSARPYVSSSCIKEIKKFDENKLLKKIQVPTLIIGSKFDEYFSINVPKSMSKKIRKSELRMLNAMHPIIIKKPEEVSNIMLKFLEKNEK